MDGSLVQSLAASSRERSDEDEGAAVEVVASAADEFVETPTRVMEGALVEALADRTRRKSSPAIVPPPETTEGEVVPLRPEADIAAPPPPLAVQAAEAQPVPMAPLPSPPVEKPPAASAVPSAQTSSQPVLEPPPTSWRTWVAGAALLAVATSGVAVVVFPENVPHSISSALHLNEIAAPDPPPMPPPAPVVAEAPAPEPGEPEAPATIAAPAPPEPAVAAAPADDSTPKRSSSRRKRSGR